MNQARPDERDHRHHQKWQMNYLEAAIFLEEGENNDKFNSHPKHYSALPAYLITHNHWFYTFDLLAALILLCLAVMEPPAIEIFKNVPVGVHGSIELFALTILGVSFIMQIRWLSLKTFVRHKRSLVKSVIWLILVAEALAVLVRNTTHFRVTRALRPIFLVDCRYLGGVRRLLRQILQSLTPILEVLGLLLFTLVIFAVIGFYLFSSNKEDPYFSSLYLAMVSLYILLTTANFPDVMMPSYAKNRWSALFFIAYLSITLYFIMNLMLAIVFVEFSNIEKEKFYKLLLHKKEACQHAFQLLITHSQPNRISFKHFQGLMQYYKPKTSRQNVYVLFKALNHSRSGSLTLKEFYGIYDALEYRWNLAREREPWFANLWFPVRTLGYFIHKLVKWKGFKILTYCVIILSAVILFIHTTLISSSDEDIRKIPITWDQLACIIFYTIEILFKLIGFGFTDFFSSGWNVFDFLVTLLALGAIIGEYFDVSFYYIVILRVFRLLRLFKFRRRYMDIFQTLAILVPRILSTAVVIFVLYYFFAILGIECFSSYDMKNCCVNTTVEQYYKSDNSTLFQSYYYLNNFDTLLVSGVTLFELTVVNNWFIIMEGYAAVSGEVSRLYFMIFYLVMMVVLAIVVAFIIEAFTFHMCYNEAFNGDSKESENIRINLTLTKEELDFIYSEETSISDLCDYSALLHTSDDAVRFVGVRKRTKFVLQRRMYSELVASWLREQQETTLPGLISEEPSSRTVPSTLRSMPLSQHSPFEYFPTDNQVIMEELSSRPSLIVEVDDQESLVESDNPFFPSDIREDSHSNIIV